MKPVFKTTGREEGLNNAILATNSNSHSIVDGLHWFMALHITLWVEDGILTFKSNGKKEQTVCVTLSLLLYLTQRLKIVQDLANFRFLMGIWLIYKFLIRCSYVHNILCE